MELREKMVSRSDCAGPGSVACCLSVGRVDTGSNPEDESEGVRVNGGSVLGSWRGRY